MKPFTLCLTLYFISSTLARESSSDDFSVYWSNGISFLTWLSGAIESQVSSISVAATASPTSATIVTTSTSNVFTSSGTASTASTPSITLAPSTTTQLSLSSSSSSSSSLYSDTQTTGTTAIPTTSSISPSFVTPEPAQNHDSSENWKRVTAITASVLGLLFLFTILLCLFLLWRRKRQRSQDCKRYKAIESSLEHQSALDKMSYYCGSSTPTNHVAPSSAAAYLRPSSVPAFDPSMRDVPNVHTPTNDTVQVTIPSVSRKPVSSHWKSAHPTPELAGNALPPRASQHSMVLDLRDQEPRVLTYKALLPDRSGDPHDAAGRTEDSGLPSASQEQDKFAQKRRRSASLSRTSGRNSAAHAGDVEVVAVSPLPIQHISNFREVQAAASRHHGQYFALGRERSSGSLSAVSNSGMSSPDHDRSQDEADRERLKRTGTLSHKISARLPIHHQYHELPISETEAVNANKSVIYPSSNKSRSSSQLGQRTAEAGQLQNRSMETGLIGNAKTNSSDNNERHRRSARDSLLNSGLHRKSATRLSRFQNATPIVRPIDTASSLTSIDRTEFSPGDAQPNRGVYSVASDHRLKNNPELSSARRRHTLDVNPERPSESRQLRPLSRTVTFSPTSTVITPTTPAYTTHEEPLHPPTTTSNNQDDQDDTEVSGFVNGHVNNIGHAPVYHPQSPISNNEGSRELQLDQRRWKHSTLEPRSSPYHQRRQSQPYISSMPFRPSPSPYPPTAPSHSNSMPLPAPSSSSSSSSEEPSSGIRRFSQHLNQNKPFTHNDSRRTEMNRASSGGVELVRSSRGEYEYHSPGHSHGNSAVGYSGDIGRYAPDDTRLLIGWAV